MFETNNVDYSWYIMTNIFFLNQIFSKRSEEKIQLIDNNDYFLLYEIYDLYKELPKKNFIYQE